MPQCHLHYPLKLTDISNLKSDSQGEITGTSGFDDDDDDDCNDDDDDDDDDDDI
jgi:hypothetical protein